MMRRLCLSLSRQLEGASSSSAMPARVRRLSTSASASAQPQQSYAAEPPRRPQQRRQRRGHGEDGPILTHLTSTSPPSRCVAPPTPPPTAAEVSSLHSLIAGSASLCVITGAGCSTESNIPDYRTPGTGAYSKGHKPMTHQQFMGSESSRRRYWARSFAGWQVFNSSRPNGAHLALGTVRGAPFARRTAPGGGPTSGRADR